MIIFAAATYLIVVELPLVWALKIRPQYGDDHKTLVVKPEEASHEASK